MSLDRFHLAVASWFAANLGEPTACQEQAWEAVAAGCHTLIATPTGSGKILAEFLTAIDAQRQGRSPATVTRVPLRVAG